MSAAATPEPGTPISRTLARKLSMTAGFRQEPYRGYAHQLPDGRQVFCAPDGLFYVRPAPLMNESATGGSEQ